MSRPRQVTDQEILKVARTVFLDKGPSVATSVIARALGVSHATLFNRFGSKEALMLAALAPPASPDWSGTDALKDRPFKEQLNELGLRLSRFFHQIAPGVSCLRAAGIDPHALWADKEVPPPVAGHQQLTRWLENAVAIGQIRKVDCEVLAMIIIGSVQSRAFMEAMLDMKGLPSIESYVSQMVDMLWEGLSP